jgi:hypothetical protein
MHTPSFFLLRESPKTQQYVAKLGSKQKGESPSTISPFSLRKQNKLIVLHIQPIFIDRLLYLLSILNTRLDEFATSA